MTTNPSSLHPFSRPPRAVNAVASLRRRRSRAAFTLVELLVSMTVLALMLVLTSQMVNQTSKVTTASTKQMDVDSMARILLDRFGNDFSMALLNNGATALYYTPLTGTDPVASANSAIGFISETRARATTATFGSDIRGAVVGYKIKDLSFPYDLSNPKTPVYIPVIQRGDGRFTFSTKNKSGTNCAAYSLEETFGTKELNIPNDISVNTTDEHILNWQGVGDGILRFHISFVLNDGRTVQSLQQPADPAIPNDVPLNATYRNFSAAGGTGLALPIAFTANTTADLKQRYVKGLIVGVAVLDEPTVRLAYQADKNFVSKLAVALARPKDVPSSKPGETPVGVWQVNVLKQVNGVYNVPFLPLRQNLRFYQRFYAVSL